MASERITSPEQLNDYIRVTTPGAWIILSSIVIFLIGFFVWIFAGSLERSFTARIYAEGKESSAFLTIDKASQLKAGMTVRIPDSEAEGVIEHVASSAISYSEILNIVGENNALEMGISEHEKLFQVTMHIDKALNNNISVAVFVVDTVKPLSFLLK